MATKIISLPEVGQVTLVKRSQSKNLRLTVTPHAVTVSLPRWTPYNTGISFALKHTAWIVAEQAKQELPLLVPAQRVGKLHAIRFEQVPADKPATTRVTGTEVIVKLHPSEHSFDPQVQVRTRDAVIRALKREAEQLLPPRLMAHAQKHAISYTSVSVKSLKRRWGSCDNHRAITLNLYLMELPWDYIDYVLLHELTHTQHMDHSAAFWQMLVGLCPRAKDLSRLLRRHQPAIGNWHP